MPIQLRRIEIELGIRVGGTDRESMDEFGDGILNWEPLDEPPSSANRCVFR